MYESFFELNQRPFPAAPLANRYWPGASIEAARSTLARCIERGSGPGLLIGASGIGKTLLCYVLAEQFKDRLALALLFSGNLTTRRDLLQAILFELGLPYRGLEEGELRLSLIDFLTRGEQCPNGLLLVIDEAHSLPLKLLEEVRMITNLMRRGQPCVRLLLAGGPMLEEHFAHPKLGSFSQRLAARCYLETLSRDETMEYVRAHVQGVGGDPARLFAPNALESVYRATDGIPRLINQVVDHALVMAHAARKRPLTAETIELAWADLQQLPTPWGETAGSRQGDSSRSASSVVEFGTLGEELDVANDLRVSMPSDELDDVESFGRTEVELVFDEEPQPAEVEETAEETIDACVEHVAVAPWGETPNEAHAVQPPMYEAAAAPPLRAGPAIYSQPSYEASTLEVVDGPALERAWRRREYEAEPCVEHVAVAPFGEKPNEAHAILPPMYEAAAAPPLCAGPAIYSQPSYEASTLEVVDGPALECAWRRREYAAEPCVEHVAIAPWGETPNEAYDIQPPMYHASDAPPLAAGPAIYAQPLYEASTLEVVDGPALEHAWRLREAALTAAEVTATAPLNEFHVSLPVDEASITELLLESAMPSEEFPSSPVVADRTSAAVEDGFEEVLFDHYGTLDAMKEQGKLLPRGARRPGGKPRQPEPIRTPAAISYSAEKTLSLAEALLRQATAAEQTAGPFDVTFEGEVESLFSLLSAPGSDDVLKETWSSVDLLPPPSHDEHAAPDVPFGSTRETPAGRRGEPTGCTAPAGGYAAVPTAGCAAATSSELDLIVVEDDPQEIVVVSPPPQAAPVKRQEYRQLFARLRKRARLRSAKRQHC